MKGAKPERESGALRIFRYNWPTYVVTWTTSSVLCIAALTRGAPWLALLTVLPLVWSALSLAVSYYIYDASELSSARWLTKLLGEAPARWVSVHAGLDAEVDLECALEGTDGTYVDIFDAASMSAPSIRRARATTRTAHEALKGTPESLPLAPARYDAVFVIFTAHEIRNPTAREAFFVEAKRLLKPTGRILLLEHVQDAPNFLAFGPGFLHFQTRREWLRLAEVTGLQVAREVRITPWVMALVLAPR